MIDETILVNALRNISLFFNVLGIIVGLDLIVGAPLISFLNSLLNKVINFDKCLANSVIRVSLGLLFVIISGLMMAFVLIAK